MGANATNALFFLVTTLFDLAMWLFLLRIVLQYVRADFYNPLSQLIQKATRHPTDHLGRVLPAWRNFNFAALLVVFLIALVYVHTVSGIVHLRLSRYPAMGYAVLKLIVMTANLYTFTLFVQALLSWLGPGVNNPASNVLWSMNEPLLRPVRRVLPSLSGLDLSPVAVILVLQVANRLIPLPGWFR
ncbi:YggT family protein [Solimonas sp. K1W22B-7]|uniref:YggT family protein n=1 Tax=Solimonas sp. K1W22B-7 TaxID=2303331 RepID=UPI000E32F709|nr:YggT family protein [Solimonas sp. K1W22B-7]AXQ28815.1 YggT family protein [Solimonas sp. K1W22B-7]